jgi:hypothetical protein
MVLANSCWNTFVVGSDIIIDVQKHQDRFAGVDSLDTRFVLEYSLISIVSIECSPLYSCFQ